ncbi:hypothetical protein SLS58_010898 [Diplodia intermedia]|uniref:Uncharacterized protein n=1 Tax=Diplodia intermedia TaxID=856260 RepID=A0ABR3T2X6_9PEZI
MPNDSDWNEVIENTPSGRSISSMNPNADNGKTLNPDSSKSECIQNSTAKAPKDLTHSHHQGALSLSKSASAARSRVMSKALARQRSRLVFGREAGANMTSHGTSPIRKPKEVREDQALSRDPPQRGKKRSLSVDTESSIAAASTADRPADTAQLAGAKLDRQALGNAERLAFLRKKVQDSIGAMTAKKRVRSDKDEDVEATADVFLGKLKEDLESRWARPRNGRASPPLPPPYAAASHGPGDTCEIVKPGDHAPANTQPFLVRDAASCGEAVVSEQAVATTINITTVLNGPPYSTADVIRGTKVHRPAQEALFAKNKLLALWRRWTAWVLREHETEPAVVGPLLWKAFRAASCGNMGGFVEAIVAVLDVLFM